jgi:hypothetical protein
MTDVRKMHPFFPIMDNENNMTGLFENLGLCPTEEKGKAMMIILMIWTMESFPIFWHPWCPNLNLFLSLQQMLQNIISLLPRGCWTVLITLTNQP